MYESDCDKVKLQLTRRTVIGCDGFKAFVMMDTYNLLKSDSHKDIVGYRGSFVLVINARRVDHYENEETIFGHSQTI